ncbi:MAG: glycosyltransferase family A protein [Mycoplasma sp.]
MNSTTIIITTYNDEKIIKQTLKNLYYQKIKTPIIFNDDCSKDMTVKIINNFIKKKKLNWKCFINKENLGSAFSRKEVAKKVDTKYLFFLDSDDIFDYEILKNEIINNPKRPLEKNIRTWSVRYYAKNKIGNFATHNETLDNHLRFQQWTLTGILWLTKTFNDLPFTKEMNMGEDLITFVKFVDGSLITLETSRPIYYWVLRKGSMINSSRSNKTLMQTINNLVNYSKLIPIEHTDTFIGIGFGNLLRSSILNPKLFFNVDWDDFKASLLKTKLPTKWLNRIEIIDFNDKTERINLFTWIVNLNEKLNSRYNDIVSYWEQHHPELEKIVLKRFFELSTNKRWS